MFTFPHNKRNANYTEIPFLVHLEKLGKLQNTIYVIYRVRVWGSRLVEFNILYETTYLSTLFNLAYGLLEIYPQDTPPNFKKHRHKVVHCNIIYNHRILQSIQTFTHRRCIQQTTLQNELHNLPRFPKDSKCLLEYTG